MWARNVGKSSGVPANREHCDFQTFLTDGMTSRGASSSDRGQHKGQPQRTDEDEAADLVELRPPGRKKLIGAHLKLTDECYRAMREAKKAGKGVRLEHHEAGTFIEIDAVGGEGKKRFECGVQRLTDQSVIDVIAVERSSGEHRRFGTLEAKMQVRATDQTFSSAAQKAHKLADDQRRAQPIQGVYTKGQKRPALVQPSTSSKAKRALLSASSTPKQHQAPVAGDKAVSSSARTLSSSSAAMHGNRDKPKASHLSSTSTVVHPKPSASRKEDTRREESRQRETVVPEGLKHTRENRPSTSSTTASTAAVGKARVGPRTPHSHPPEVETSQRATGSDKSTVKKWERVAAASTASVNNRPRIGPRTPLSTPPEDESPHPAGGETPQREPASKKPVGTASSTTQNKTQTKSPAESPRRRPHPTEPSTSAKASVEGADRPVANRAAAKATSHARIEPIPAALPLTAPAATILGSPASAHSTSTFGSSPPVRAGGARSSDASPFSPLHAATVTSATTPHTNGTLPALNGWSGLNRPTAVATDWWAELTPIDSPSKLNDYRVEYKSCYDEYAKLYRQLDRVASQFRKLKADFDKHPTDETVKKIRSLYEKHHADDEFYTTRQRHTELRAKLVVLKQRVGDYAAETSRIRQSPKKK